MRFFNLLRLLLALALTSLFASAQQPWRYDFRTGDHLVYSELLEKESTGQDFQQKSRISFTSHVLVLGESNGTFSIGTQRNRNSATLVSYRGGGKEAAQQQLVRFQEAAAKIVPRTSESNEFSASGGALGFWQVRREWPSRLLFSVHEIDKLPEGVLKPGDKWHSSGMLGLDFTYLRDEKLAGENCALLEGNGSGGRLRLQYWFGLTSHLLQKVIYFGEYQTPFGSVRESLTFQLEELRRGESIEKWLGNPDTQLAALNALERSPWITAPSEQVTALAQGEPGPAKATASGLLLRRGAMKNAASSASVASPIPGDTYRPMETAPHRGYPYILHVPQSYLGDKPFPLLIYLSGGPGFAIEGLNSSARSLDDSEFLVLYPNAIGMWWEKDSEKLLQVLITETFAKYNVDRTRVYIAGFSNGATGSLHFASLWPERFRGVVSLMGAGNCMEGTVDSNQLSKLPILLVHGEKDSVIPAQCSKDLFKALAKRTKEVRLEILPGREHDITLDNDNGLTLEFIRKLEHP